MRTLIHARDTPQAVCSSTFHHVLRTVFLHHTGQSAPNRQVTSDNYLDAVHTYLEEHFYADLFVRRPEILVTLNRLISQPVSVFHGGRGTGKTTMIRLLADLIMNDTPYEELDPSTKYPQNPGAADEAAAIDLARSQLGQAPEWYFYVDIEDIRLQLERNSASVPDELFDLVRERYRALFPDIADDEWNHYLEAKYPPLAEALESFGRLDTLPAGEAPTSLVTERALASTYDALNGFANEPGGFRLDCLLQHLSARHGIRVGIAVDNIDLFHRDIQVDLADIMMNLSNRGLLQCSLIGVRSENVKFLVEKMSGFAGFNRDDTVAATIDTTGFAVLYDIVRLRAALIPTLLALPDVANAIAKERPTLSPDAMVRVPNRHGHDAELHVINGLLAPGSREVQEDPLPGREHWEHFANLLRWHNDSVRSVAYSVYQLGLIMTADLDPLYSLEDAWRLPSFVDGRRDEPGALFFGRALRNQFRFVRDLFVRKYVSVAMEQLEFNDAMLLYSTPDGSLGATQFPYLRLHILLFLMRQQNMATIGELCTLFSKYGVVNSRTRRSIESLRQSRASLELGLVYIDSAAPVQHLDGRTEVSLLPAGQFMANRLCVYSDYLFWNGFIACNPESHFGEYPPSTVAVETLASEAYRIDIALQFLERRVVPRFLSIYSLSVDATMAPGPFDRKQWLMEYLETFGHGLVPSRIATEIESYAGGVEDSAFRESVRIRVRAIHDAVEAPFLEAGIRWIESMRIAQKAKREAGCY